VGGPCGSDAPTLGGFATRIRDRMDGGSPLCESLALDLVEC